MSDNPQKISLSLLEAVFAQGLDAGAQAALAQAIAKLKVDLVDLGIEIVETPPCQHSLIDDGMFTVACSECGVSVDAEPDTKMIDRIVKEALEGHMGVSDSRLEIGDDELHELLCQAASESIVNHVFGKPGQ